ncbi:hypothetical protein [Chitinasiproducens palmae]|uniref:Uncharacterized protein n=1 Tax=Chitinasiproducens palmae TaxID=1770053 RepID=A0A1H2PQK3_9BURK|nr:hypothetical protein [Chitinasiproducens palmae]SDV48683.1 hypothetical protein SAMN05216551_105296 [Chitinasiproducens palmae]
MLTGTFMVLDDDDFIPALRQNDGPVMNRLKPTVSDATLTVDIVVYQGYVCKNRLGPPGALADVFPRSADYETLRATAPFRGLFARHLAQLRTKS